MGHPSLTFEPDQSRLHLVYDFVREALRIGGREHVPVEPITLDDFQRASTPPRFAPLANTAAAALGVTLRPWQQALEEFLKSQ